jgi:hypothetical protein
MVGLGADVVAGDEPDDHDAAGRAAARSQRRRAGRRVAALTRPLREWMAEHGTRPVFDAVIHEQDLRGALGVPGAQDNDGLAAARDRYVARFAGRLDRLPPISLVGETWRWDSQPGVEPAVVVQAPDFELNRALLTRWSADQLRAWTVRGDIEPYLPAFAALGSLPDRPLTES